MSLSSELTVFHELRCRKTVRFSEHLMSAEKFPTTFSRQVEAIEFYIQKTRTYAATTDKTKKLLSHLRYTNDFSYKFKTEMI